MGVPTPPCRWPGGRGGQGQALGGAPGKVPAPPGLGRGGLPSTLPRAPGARPSLGLWAPLPAVFRPRRGAWSADPCTCRRLRWLLGPPAAQASGGQLDGVEKPSPPAGPASLGGREKSREAPPGSPPLKATADRRVLSGAPRPPHSTGRGGGRHRGVARLGSPGRSADARGCWVMPGVAPEPPTHQQPGLHMPICALDMRVPMALINGVQLLWGAGGRGPGRWGLGAGAPVPTGCVWVTVAKTHFDVGVGGREGTGAPKTEARTPMAADHKAPPPPPTARSQLK